MKSQKIDKRNIVIPLTEGLESHMTPVKHFNLLREDVEDLTADLASNVADIDSDIASVESDITAINAVLQQSNTITASAGGTGAAAISEREQFVSITSTNVAHIVALPSLASVGLGAEICGAIANTACRLMVNVVDRTGAAYINNATGGNHLVLNAGTAAYFEAVKVTAARWIVKTWSSAGGPTTVTPAL